MKVLVVGANGQVGKHLVEKIQNSESIQAKAMIRKAEQAKISIMHRSKKETIIKHRLENNKKTKKIKKNDIIRKEKNFKNSQELENLTYFLIKKLNTKKKQ